jgi:predicted enzyme related to lactoylglutathione lyase
MDYDIKLNSLYICVENMDRAKKFYENIFGIKTDKDRNDMFIVGNFRFLLFDYKGNKEVIVGNNCLPSFEVSDIDKFINKLNKLNVKIIFPKTKILNNWVLEFKDTEGNEIEIYSKIK